ncbi:Methylthioadenosine phosphorylase [Cryphonectria parasitica EP155]|uniref:S-methyl-5'-thioadenosine phosphorylase n=1 Tax=Cryphonectria parasitica (strain ATCC 38755 / EP155) TaxID=660469 RepID=A0A9P5CL13_CRYP1|nr:Methylthioadenosine phosphorylase [Cryphonectria parasitica EP155]KAF3761747.1 Methylthioadenosine phosphorylase [Cryphonectria parasitica EP155]
MAHDLPEKFDRPVHIAVIGGTGLSQIEGYIPVASVNPLTPWGHPSAPIQILEHSGVPVAFLSRHGAYHEHAPHEVPSRANIAALRHIGVRCVIAFSAVGSLQEHIRPMDFVVPDQIIDRTKGVRPFTFFEKGLVGHVGFADPFDEKLAKVVKACAGAMQGEGSTLHESGTIVCMEGPQFSTRAESNMYRTWGGSVINMSALPEAKLAREAELAYQMICMATDYDCWRSVPGEDVDVAMVMKYMSANSVNAKRLVGAVLDELVAEDKEHGDLVVAKHLEGASVGAVKFMTKPAGRDPKAMERVEYLFPNFWKD